MKLVLMYVYYDKNGDIRSITPEEDMNLSKSYSHVFMPLSEVEDFILGKKNSFEYVVKKIEKISGDKYILAKKFTNIVFARSMDNYLTKISSTSSIEPVVRVIVNPSTNKIVLLLNQSFKDMYEYGTYEEKEKIEDFVLAGYSDIHFTEKNNPYNLYTSISFLPKELFDKLRLDFKYDETIDLSSCSAYTKRLVSSYQFLIKDRFNAI